MSDLIAVGAAQMTSREIADLVQSRHDSVKRTIERLADQGVIELPPTVEIPTATKPVTVYVFSGAKGKRDSIVVVAQLSPEFTARLVDRWQELEMGLAVIPKSLPEALRLAADLAEKKAQAEAALAIAAPKAEALDRLAAANGSLCVTDAAKALQMQPKKLFSWLRENRWIYRRSGSSTWLGYQDRVMTGVLEHKVTTVLREDGTEKVVEQVRVTPKGLTKIASEIQKENAPAAATAEASGAIHTS